MSSINVDSPGHVPVTLRFTYAYEDFHRFESFSWRREFFSYRIVGWLLVATVSLAIILRVRAGEEVSSIFNAGVLICLAASVAFLYIRFKKSNKSRWEAAHPQQLLAVTLSSDGVRVEYPTIKMHFQWATFHRFETHELGFTLQSPYGQNLFLPYRPMTAEQIEQVHAILQFHIGPTRHPTRAFPVEAAK